MCSKVKILLGTGMGAKYCEQRVFDLVFSLAYLKTHQARSQQGVRGHLPPYESPPKSCK